MVIRQQCFFSCVSLVTALTFCFLFVPIGAVLHAETIDDMRSSLTMTIAPPLFQLTLAPGATWSSTLRISNRNTYPLTLYAVVQNFTANGETGMISFATQEPSLNPNSHELASWMKLPGAPVVVGAGKTGNIPFTIRVPTDAEPGGHYAGILVGTQPLSSAQYSEMGVGSLLSSLLFVRTTGDIFESGYIRDFSPLHVIVPTQETTLALHFQNNGNVHLSPRGAITIRNMFGRARGTIILDEQNTFGHVLPDSSRQFIFAWKSEQNFFDIGRYTAVAELSYGENLEKIAHDSTSLWIIPWAPLCSITGFLLFALWFCRRMLQRYVAHALALELLHKKNTPVTHTKSRISFAFLRAPLEEGRKDFGRVKRKHHTTSPDGTHHITVTEFIKKYRVAFLSIVIFSGLLGVTILYFAQVFDDERNYQMTIKKDGGADIVVTPWEEGGR